MQITQSESREYCLRRAAICEQEAEIAISKEMVARCKKLAAQWHREALKAKEKE